LDVAFSPSAWVNVGDNVRLECLGGESSSNITWTFQGKTFVVCKKWNTPVPAVPNVICRQVYQLFLKNTTKASEGLYGCETAAERSKKKRLRVHLSVTPTTTFAGKSSVTSLVTPFSSLTVTTTNTSNSSLSVVSANNSTANLSVVASLITTVTMRNSDNTYSPNFMVTRPVDMSALTNYLTVQPDPDIVGDDEGNKQSVILSQFLLMLVLLQHRPYRDCVSHSHCSTSGFHYFLFVFHKKEETVFVTNCTQLPWYVPCSEVILNLPYFIYFVLVPF
jgi:hypothetical protein